MAEHGSRLIGWLRSALVVLALPGLFALWLKYCDQDRIRYSEYPCHYEVISAPPAHIDYLVLGNSRGQVGIMADVLSSALGPAAEAGAGAPIVVDLSKSWRGPELLLTFARDVLARHQVDTVLLEFNLAQSPQVKYHPRAPYVLKTGELAALLMEENRDPMLRKLSRAVQWLLNRSVLRMEQLLSGTGRRAPRPDATVETMDCNTTGRLVRVKANLSLRKSTQPPSQDAPGVSWDLLSDHERLNTHYYRKIIDYIRGKGARVILFHVPRYRHAHLDEYFARRVEGLLRVPLIRLPPLQARSFQAPGSFHDPTHLSRRGARRFSRWLGQEVRRTIESGDADRS